MDQTSDSEPRDSPSYREEDGPSPQDRTDGSASDPADLEEAFRSLLTLRQSMPTGVSFEPIAAAMVESVLTKVLGSYGVPPATQRLLSEQIARSLSDDAVAGPRMEELWDQLEALSSDKTG